MRLLFLTPQMPYPPRQGAALRNWGLISNLARDHDVTVLTFAAPSRSPGDEGPLRALARVETVTPPVRTLRARLRDLLTTRQPDMALRLAAPRYARRLAALLAETAFDVVQIGGIEMAPYLDTVRAASAAQVVFDDYNCEYLLQKRAFLTDLRSPRHWPGAAYSFIQWRRLRRYEAHICRRADLVLAVSERDGALLRRLAPGREVLVIPNGIESDAYRLDRVPPWPRLPSPALVFTGTMDFRPNVDAVLWFARRVLPRIRAQVTGVHLFVVGQRPHRRLAALRADPAITLTGWVADARPYIAQATVYVAPLRIGGGTRLKLLEAMALSRPVVATRLGAEGYPVADGRELLLADRPAEFAAAVVALLRDPARRAALGEAARAFVERGYDWRAIVPRLERRLGERRGGHTS